MQFRGQLQMWQCSTSVEPRVRVLVLVRVHKMHHKLMLSAEDADSSAAAVEAVPAAAEAVSVAATAIPQLGAMLTEVEPQEITTRTAVLKMEPGQTEAEAEPSQEAMTTRRQGCARIITSLEKMHGIV